MQITLDLNSAADYATFLKIKTLPQYRFRGRTAYFPDEYAARLGLAVELAGSHRYQPIADLFDYQQAIAEMAIAKQKFAVFAECGLGKTMIMLEYGKHVKASLPSSRSVLIVSPLMVIGQTIAECRRWHGDSLPIEQVRAANLTAWLNDATPDKPIGITNYEALQDETPQGSLGSLIIDESSMLKSAYGKWGSHCLRLGRGLDWKLALTGTPAPNDRIEYANHAVFLDAFPTVNSFLARFFVNRGQTNERWEMKPHASEPFYRAMSHWCIFLTNPATYGWRDNAETIPPIHVHIHEVGLTENQKSQARDLTGTLFANGAGGIGNRAKLARIAKTGDSAKPAFICNLIASWPEESTIVWCRFNDEQDQLASVIPGAASISGSTPMEKRAEIVADFQAGKIKTIVTKPKLLGFGLNLQVCTRQVFSSLHDSYEEFHQAVKRSNRVGSSRPLNVHVPVTDVELPMVENVLRKAERIQRDTEEQERIFQHATVA